MNQLAITPQKPGMKFRPGEEIAGEVSWQLDAQPKSVELRLFWFTRGKGTEDVSVVQMIPFDAPALVERRPFRIALPDSPYSFSGKLITLAWALELIALPAKEAARFEFTLSPTGEEVLLDAGV